jgi:flotillin
MNQEYILILTTAAIILVLTALMVTVFTRYTKVGPNQVLIVSGRKAQLPDGHVAGFRILKGGGTFVFPVFERADKLSLEAVTVDMLRVPAQAVDGRLMKADCAAQVKIKGDNASIVAAAEYFLNKNQDEMKGIVRPILEKHLNRVLGSSRIDEDIHNPAAYANKVQIAASADLEQMGLNLISFTIRDIRNA